MSYFLNNNQFVSLCVVPWMTTQDCRCHKGVIDDQWTFSSWSGYSKVLNASLATSSNGGSSKYKLRSIEELDAERKFVMGIIKKYPRDEAEEDYQAREQYHEDLKNKIRYNPFIHVKPRHVKAVESLRNLEDIHHYGRDTKALDHSSIDFNKPESSNLNEDQKKQRIHFYPEDIQKVADKATKLTEKIEEYKASQKGIAKYGPKQRAVGKYRKAMKKRYIEEESHVLFLLGNIRFRIHEMDKKLDGLSHAMLMSVSKKKLNIAVENEYVLWENKIQFRNHEANKLLDYLMDVQERKIHYIQKSGNHC